ncbi:DNA (cytosine-5-)-methyltransferase [Dolosigranulum pigrum]|nr:DNA cytosine methyltransferase [Dolosigranulum pigrum]QTJ53368.1 DNA cytosine methyltransferase [Dolosigranulum pigrum]RAN58274.1 DNA (cytosine-5-)-methyltransferase [Dolosigranulum pigrum]
MTYKSIELFAGAGGMALGLEKAGFEHIGLVEIDTKACETLRINRPNWNIIENDIREVTNNNLLDTFNLKKGELDLLSGGAPCQSFSYAGNKLGIEDTRGTMFYHYATFLKELQPKMFLFENVKGMLSHDSGKTFNTILSIFKNQGYNVKFEVLNSVNYGVAQKRERLIVVGIRNDLENIGFQFPEKYDYKLVLRDILKNVPKSKCSQYSKKKKEVFKLVPPGGYWKHIPEEKAKEYMGKSWEQGGGRTGILRRLSMDEPSLTILTSPQMKRTERCHPEETRPFSVRECARIQSFPDDWKFSGGMGDQYKQIGNAVPVLLAKAVGEEIFNSLEGKTDVQNRQLQLEIY